MKTSSDNTQRHQKALADIGDYLDEMRDAWGAIGVARNKNISIDDAERDMIIATSLIVIGAAFEKIDEIYSD